MAKYLVDLNNAVFKIVIFGFSAWVGRDLCSNQKQASRLAAAANFSFLPEYRKRVAMFYVMGGETFDTLSSQRDSGTGNLVWQHQSTGPGYRNYRAVYDFPCSDM